MIDMSRNAVMTLPALKRFLQILKDMGYSCLWLYTEDTYEVDGEPYFGYMRGRYTKEEMKELDRFGNEIGMEIIPCIQTLAHLNAFLRWKQVPIDCNDILLVDDPRTYELIEHMFATLSECYSTRKVHVGLDEAHMLGRGKHLDLHGYEGIDVLMQRHLNRVREIAKKYGYEEILLWSDMYFRSWNNGSYRIPKREVPKEIIDNFPQDVIPVYWDYHPTNEGVYRGMLQNHKQFSNKTWFAGGAWCWTGMIPHNRFTLQASIPAIDACRAEGCENMIVTMWGDDGAECSHFSQLPSLYYLAEYAKGNTDESVIKSGFQRKYGIDFDAYMEIDCPNDVVPYTGDPQNPSKYMLYSDYFNGFLDDTVQPGAGARYHAFAARLYATAKQSHRYGYVFESAAKLCEVLAVKYELGLRLRKAYKNGDKVQLRSIAEHEMTELPRLIRAYAKAFEKQWMCENKPHGFDVQHQRLGGLLYRTDCCRQRLLDYVNGKLESIAELEEELLPFRKKEVSTCVNRAPIYATVNVLHHDAWIF